MGTEHVRKWDEEAHKPAPERSRQRDSTPWQSGIPGKRKIPRLSQPTAGQGLTNYP